MEFRLLGPLEVLEDGRALVLGGRRQRAALAHLLLHRGTPLSGDWLIEQVWGEAAPPAVRASLHTYVSRLRAALGAARLETRSSGYVLHAGAEEVDAARLEECLTSARRKAGEDVRGAAADYDVAVGLSRGPALGDLADEPSLQAEAVRLDGLVLAARRERLAVLLRLGESGALVPELEALLGEQPLDEDLWGDLLLALYRCGRRADALAAYQRARTTLRDELGLEPSTRLRQVHEQVLRQDPVLTLAGSALRGYRLLEEIGSGASAVVHRAVQPHTGREVALKALRPRLADDPELVRHFAAETSAALQCEHPSIVPLYDGWREPGGAFLAMRLLRGGDLAQRLQRASLPATTLVRIAEQVTGAMRALLDRGVLDSPLGLEDVLLDQEDNAFLSGFCLARQLTAVPVTFGTTVRPGPDGAVLGRLLLELLQCRPDAPPSLRAVAERAVSGDFPDADAVCAALRVAVPPVVPAPRRAVEDVPVRNPYKGLRAFGEADAGDFFGRSALVAALVARMSEPAQGRPRRFLAVVGPSGSGKSSLVRAGLVPALRAGAVADVPGWHVADMVPGLDPAAELVRALQDVAVRPLPADAADRTRSGNLGLRELVQTVLPDDGSDLLLLVDQFEELFTQVEEAPRRTFLDELVEVATTADSRVRVVVTLRADFYDRPLGSSALAELVRDGTEVVVPLTPHELEQAVVEPAERVGLTVEPALLAQVVADVRDTSTALPLLQYALTELAERCGSGVLTLGAYRELGGVGGALVRRADDVYRALTDDAQGVARRLLLQLVHPDESGTDTRRRVPQSELEHRTGDPQRAREVLAALGAARLVTFDRDSLTRASTVEVAHEALLREWGLLRGWLDAARDDLRTQRRSSAAAREWDDAGRDPSFLATGSRLDALERWASRWSGADGWAATPVERDFLEASLRARDDEHEQARLRERRELELERRSVRRLRVAALVLAVAVVGISTLTVYGFSQRDRAERESTVAQARALAAAASASLPDDPERSVLLAVEAVRMSRSADGSALPEAQEALHNAVTASRVLVTMPGVGGMLDWSAQGLLVTEGPEDSGAVELRDGATGQVVRSFPGHGIDVNDVAFSPDGSRLLTTGDDGAARLWDPATGRLVWERVTAGQVWAPTFSGDGRRVAVSWRQEGVVRVLDASTGAVVGELRSVPDPYTTALTHDGKRVVVTGDSQPGAVVHDVGTGEVVEHITPDGPSALEVDVSPDGRWLVTAGLDLRVRIWSLEDFSLRTTLRASGPVPDVDWSPDSSRLVLGSEDGVVRVFALDDEGSHEVLRLGSTVLRGVLGVAFSPDGQRVLLGDLDVGAAQVFDISVGGSREVSTAPVPFDIVSADFTAGGAEVVASAAGGGLVFRDVGSGAALRTIGASRGHVSDVRTSPDGELVAGAADGAVVVWDVGSGQERFAVPTDGARSLAWAPDGRRLAFSAGNSRLHIVDRTGQAVPVPPQAPQDGIDTAAFTPEGTRLVTSHRRLDRVVLGTGHVEVHDLSSGQLLTRWDVDAERLVVSPDGRLVAQTTPAGEIVLHDLATGRRSTTLAGHASPVWDVDFSPDGRQLVTSGQDATARLWDLRSGRQTTVLRGHSSVVMTGRFSPDGSRLVTTSGDETLRVWTTDLDELLRIAEARLTRAMTEDECRRYLQRACD